jgi:serine/threonine-protein kinase
MAERFIRCQLCGIPHPADVRECPIHRKPIVAAARMEARSAADDQPPSHAPPKPPPSPQLPTVPVSPASLVGRLIAGRYRVQSVIATGGMGVVYDAMQVALGRRVAIKCLHPRYDADPTALARFQNEAVVSGSFGHPNIVEVFDLGTLDDTRAPFLVMERLEGQTLGQRLAREKRLSVSLTVSIARQVLSALAATHARGILHRDLKPDNLFLVRALDGHEHIKVLDFGLSKAMAGSGSARITRSGVVMGTPSYMPFEQATGEPDLDGRTDLYALGVILYECLTGRVPYTARTPAALVLEFKRVRPPTPRLVRPEVPAALDAVVMRAIARERHDRFADAVEMQRALASFAEPEGPIGDEDPTVIAAPPSDIDTQPVQVFARKP